MRKIKISLQKAEPSVRRHILTDSEDKCKEILEEIENGTKAFEMAAQESIPPCLFRARKAEILANSAEARW